MTIKHACAHTSEVEDNTSEQVAAALAAEVCQPCLDQGFDQLVRWVSQGFTDEQILMLIGNGESYWPKGHPGMERTIYLVRREHNKKHESASG